MKIVLETLGILSLFQTVSARSINSVVIGRLGEELDWNFPPDEKKEEYNQLITNNKIQIQDLKRELKIGFKKINSTEEVIVFKAGKSMNQWASDHTDTFIDYDTLMVKIIKLEMKDVGTYKIYSGTDYLGQTCLSVTGRPQITRREIPNLVLKPGQNQTTTTLACPSVSTSIGDCQLASTMYIIWYQNGVRMTELDPTLSQINVTVDLNGDNFTCLVMDYIPCYYSLQTTNYYNEVRNITDCNGVTEKRTFFIKPELPDILSEDVNVWAIIVPVIIAAIIAGTCIVFWYRKCRRAKIRT